ncbi:hypothetical protein [Allohahella sp. A8]|uniref:hypothetical protein n=1 Tax=Allohahella sp. A8 TaxID=3141461 RepID=UPI003A806BF1
MMQTGSLILLAVLIFAVIYLAAFFTYHVSRQEGLEPSQKTAIYLLIWLMPIIGPAITIAALGSELVAHRRPGIPLFEYLFLAAVIGPGDREYGVQQDGVGVEGADSRDQDY